MNLPCLFCGEPEVFELFEVWGHEFQIETCCEGLHEHAVAEASRDPAYRAHLLREMRTEERTGLKVRRMAEDEGQFILDFRMELQPVALKVAKSFVEKHHKHCGPPAGWRFGQAIWNGSSLMGVAMVGRPVARMLDRHVVVEVNRCCVRRDLPEALRWNACSQLYGWAAREAEKRGFGKIITYTRADEEGTALIAAGWTRECETGGGSWDRKRRRRAERSANQGRKVRWCRMLKPRRPREAAPAARS